MPRDEFNSKIGLSDNSDEFMNSAGDIAEQTGNRLVGGTLDIGGIGGDANILAGEVGNWIGNRYRANFEGQTEDTPYDPEQRITKGYLPTSEELKHAVGYSQRVPKTAAGKVFNDYAGDIIEMAPGAIALGGGPGALLRGGVKAGVRQAASRVVRGAAIPDVVGKGTKVVLDQVPGVPDNVKGMIETGAETLATVGAHGIKGPNVKSIVASRATQVKTDIIEKAIKDAEDSGIGKAGFNREQALRNQFADIIRDPAKFNQFSAAEQQAIRRTAGGGTLEKIMMKLGTFAPENVNWNALKPYIIASIFGMPKLGAAVSGAAEGAKRVTSEMTKRSAKTTLGMVKEGADRKIPNFPGIKPAAATGIKVAATPTQKWELVDPEGYVRSTTITKFGDPPPRILSSIYPGVRWQKAKPDKMPLIQGGEPALMDPGAAAPEDAAPAEPTPPDQVDNTDDPFAEFTGDQ
jgi:hypothetical protein